MISSSPLVLVVHPSVAARTLAELLALAKQRQGLRAVVVTSATRSTALPDVPTIVEAGFPDLVTTTWYGGVTPAGMPPEVVATLDRAINTAVANPAFRDGLLVQGGEAIAGTSAQFGDFLTKELVRWSSAVKASRAKIDSHPIT